MREIRETSKTSSVERVAVMAALNLAHDFQRKRARDRPRPRRRRRSTARISPPRGVESPACTSAIDQVLAGKEKLF